MTSKDNQADPVDEEETKADQSEEKEEDQQVESDEMDKKSSDDEEEKEVGNETESDDELNEPAPNDDNDDLLANPDLSTMTDEELDEYTESTYENLAEWLRFHDPDYSIHSKYNIHLIHSIDLGDILIATILALIFIHMFLRDFIRGV